MITQLGKEKDEIKHKDFCTDEFNKTQLETEKKERERQDLEARIEDLELTIKTLTKQIDALKAWRCRHAPRLLQCSVAEAISILSAPPLMLSGKSARRFARCSKP